MTKKRFIKTQHRGIRKDTTTGQFQARKTIKGKEYTKTFDKILKAIEWRSSFHPDLESTQKESTNKVDEPKFTSRANGVDDRFTFKQIWDFYVSTYLPTIEKQSARDSIKRGSNLLPWFYKYKMVEINAEVIDSILKIRVEEEKVNPNLRRYSFDKELEILRAVLNWYRENYDAMFIVPVLKRHFQAGTVRHKKTFKKKKMTPEQVFSFFEAIDDDFWRDFAEIHFFMAGRVQEPAGLQWESIDFEKRLMVVTDVTVWGYDKTFEYLKEKPKNGEERVVYLNDKMIEILLRHFKRRDSTTCPFFRESNGKRLDFVFHNNGVPLPFRQIQYRYNKALKRAGLFPEFSATHILRKAMANIVRQNLGLEAAQAVGGWKSRDVVEKIYTDNAPTSLNKEAVNVVQEILLKLEQTGTKKS